MPSLKEQFSFTIQRLKGFWNQYKRSKRGVLGVGIIMFFAVVAIFAPLIAPLDPLNPKWPGYYPGGEQPKQAEKLCVPIWYKSVLGMNQLSESIQLIENHELTSRTAFEQWVPIYDPTYTSVQYNETRGQHNNDGCIEILYKREEGQAAPQDNKTSITFTKSFEYPYENNPQSFWWHYSLSLENKTPIILDFPIEVSVQFRRGNEPDAIPAKTISLATPLLTGEANETKWYSKAGTTLGELSIIEETTFTKAGNYTYEFVVTIFDPEGSNSDLRVYVDNLQLILYGEVFGLLGTSSFPEASPRDLFTMLVHGTRISFMIGILTAIFSVLIGLIVGLVSGYVGGLVDEGLMRFADFLLVLPGLPLLIVLVTVLGKSIWNIIGVLIFMGWMGFSRTVRSMTLSLRERPFIESAKAAGANKSYIIFRHIVPNVFALVYISLATSVPGAIIAEASLAWLGLGDINIPSWGIMLFDFSKTQTAVVKGIGEYWFWVIPPGFAIALMAMAFILMGFSLDEILNPRLRKRR